MKDRELKHIFTDIIDNEFAQTILYNKLQPLIYDHLGEIREYMSDYMSEKELFEVGDITNLTTELKEGILLLEELVYAFEK